MITSQFILVSSDKISLAISSKFLFSKHDPPFDWVFSNLTNSFCSKFLTEVLYILTSLWLLPPPNVCQNQLFCFFTVFFYFLGDLKTCLTQFSRVLDKHSCVDQHLRKKLKYVAFCLIIHHFLHQNLAKIEKSRVGWVFEVCSTQTQFKIYNTKVFSSDFATTWL